MSAAGLDRGIEHLSEESDALGAVLFDMDGLLVETEDIWYEVEKAVMHRYGASWGHEQQAELVGGSLERSSSYMVAHAGLDLPWQAIGRELLDGMVARLADGVQPRPGALELLAELEDAGVPRALVSSSERVLVDAVLRSIGAGQFAFTVSGDDVTRLKPHPEPYLTAVRRLGLAVRDVVVLEDSPTGVAAAQAAGCPVVMVPSVVALDPAPGRTVVGSLEEISVARLRAIVAESRRICAVDSCPQDDLHR